MPPQLDDSACTLCHGVSGSVVAIKDAHMHPLANPAISPGLHVAITVVAEAGANNADGTIDPGEKVAAVFTIRDDAGADIAPGVLSSFQAVISGPTTNPNLLYSNSVPTAALGAGPTYTINLPQIYHLEFLGNSTASGAEKFTTARTPHWNVAGATTTVFARTATGATTLLTAAASPANNYIDVASSAGFNRDDVIVISDGVGGSEEYVTVQYVDVKRLWFSSLASSAYKPSLLRSHLLGATASVVTRDVPPGSVVMGVPARVVRDVPGDELLENA